MTTTPSAIGIRLATPHDAPALAELARRTFTDTFAADNSPDDLARFLDDSYGTAIQARELGDPTLTYLVAERDGELVAFALLRAGNAAEFVDDLTAIEIQRFYVDRPAHGSGLAQRLMTECVAQAATSGARSVFLGVWERNAKALRFYAAQGFREVGSHTFHVGGDAQQDVILQRDLVPQRA